MHVCNRDPTITIQALTQPDTGIPALTLFSIYSYWIRFAHGTSRFDPFLDASRHAHNSALRNTTTPMPPKRTNRLPLRTANDCGSAETMRPLIGHGTPSLASQISTPNEPASPRVFPEAEIDDDQDEDGNTDDEDEDEEQQPEDNHGKAQAHSTDRGNTVRSEVTMADMWDMLEQQGKLVELLFQHSEMKPKDPESPNPKNKFNVTHSKRYCRGARELETFLGSLPSNFRTHNHLFPGGDTDKVQYTINHLRSWVNHPDHTLQKTNMINPVTWGQDQLADDHPCLHDLDLFITEIRKQYGDKNQGQNSSTRAIHEMMQGDHNPDENIRAYANRLWQNCRESGPDEEHHKIMLYDMIWAGLKPYLWPKLRPFTKTNGRLDSINELFNRAANVETPRKSDKQQQSTEIGGGNQKGKKRPHQQSVSTPSGGGWGSGLGSGLGSGWGSGLSTGTRGGSGPGSGSKRPPAPWVNTEERQGWQGAGVCLRCGAKGHLVFECTKDSRALNPEQNKPENQDQPTSSDDRQIKRQRSFDPQQQKN